MIAIFAKVECQFWTDKRVRREMSEDARTLFLYLLTCPHRNLIGLFYLPEMYALNDLGWVAPRYRKALKQLIDLDRVSFDYDTDLILIHNHLKHNQLENVNMVKGAIYVLDNLPDTILIHSLAVFVDKYQKASPDLLLKAIKERAEGVAKPFRNPFETVSNSVTVTVTETETVDKDIYAQSGDFTQAQNDPKNRQGEQRKRATTLDPLLFEQFWAAYPKKRSRGQAERAWQKLKVDEQLFADILEALGRAKKSTDWSKENGKYIPYPATWLNAKGWEDEYLSDAIPETRLPKGLAGLQEIISGSDNNDG